MKRYIETVKKLMTIAPQKKWTVVSMFLSCFLYNIASLLPPLATSGIIAAVTAKQLGGIWIYVGLYLLFYFLYFSALKWNYYTYTVLADYYHIEVQKDLFNHISNNDSIFDKISKGKIIETCSDDIRYLVDVMNNASKSLMGILKIVVIFFIFCYYNIFVAIFAIGLDLLYLGLMNENAKRVSKFYEGTRKYEDKIIDIFNQMLMNLKQVRSLNLMDKLNHNLDKSRSRWAEQYKEKRVNLTNRYCTTPYIVYIGKIILYIFLAYLVVEDKMSIDKLVLLISYYEMTITVTDTTLDFLLDLGNYGVRVNRIAHILEYSPQKEVDYGDLENDYINGVVQFKNVHYNIRSKEILKDVNFKALPNEITTIVGHSGSGKTTIIHLLYRLIHVKSGSILIDDESVYNYTKKVYSSNVSGVFQNPFIFEMSIRDNLGLVDSNVENQIEACKRVGIHDFITSLPKGYNTIVSEESTLISVGQKQLIVIARALLSKAEILLFDEVTSNIDASYTEEIANLLIDLKSDHTIIMVTHKPEMMEIADRVIVLDKGRVVAKGTNKSVYTQSSLYRELRNRTFASISTRE